MNNEAVIDEILQLKTWAIVGLSNNQERAAFRVAKTLIEHGHKIIPIHPKAETVHGQPGFATLSDVKEKIDVVDIFVNSDLAGAVVEEAIKIGAKAVWLQLGVIDPEAVSKAQTAKLFAVMDRCPAIEYGKRAHS